MMPPVIVLAGGKGKRLQSFSQQRFPKPLAPVPVGDGTLPFFSFPLACLQSQGFRRIVICVDHLAEQIEDHYGDGDRFGLEITYSRAGHVGTGSRMRRAFNDLDGDIALIYCADIFHPIDLVGFVRNFPSEPSELIRISLHDGNSVPNARLDMLLGDGDRLSGYRRKPHKGERLMMDTGIMAIHRDAIGLLPASVDFSIRRDLYPILIDGQMAHGVASHNAFYDIGTPDDFRNFCRFAAETQLQPAKSGKQRNPTDQATQKVPATA